MKKKIAFTLSMPNRGSWDGKWSGESRPYLVVRSYGDDKANVILGGGSYRYSWSDGWTAQVSVREVDAAEASRLRKLSKGFCGYEWMIDSIESRGRIVTDCESSAEVSA